MTDDLPEDTVGEICLCLNVADEQIAACCAAGHQNLKEIMEITQACTRCFGCESDLQASRSGWRSQTPSSSSLSESR